MLQYISAGTNNLQIQNLDSAVARVFNSMYSNPLLNSPTYVENITFTAGQDIDVSHRLGRTPRGYITCSLTSGSVIYTSSTTNPNTNLYLILKSTEDTVASLLFF
jgi:hypothetical protein